MPETIHFTPALDFPADGSIRIYGMGTTRDTDIEKATGAVMKPGQTCTKCGEPFQVGEHLAAHLKPNMAGTFHHSDCNDPRRENLDA